ncbi:MAG TPA: plastocyanin/azurin family copper-binding protein [Terriglobales bacterium]|nr:plastocyanin/azurin family copper-binding protein [Terriglobales bacterium]
MTVPRPLQLSWLCRFLLLFALPAFPYSLFAQWQATVGAQSKDKAQQVLAFLPNEMWIHAGDSITWKVATDEPHTITFLKAGQVRPPYQAGCPGFSVSGAAFDGSTCVTTGPLPNGQFFTVTFPNPGNYKLVCLIHQNMTGVVHVLDWSQPLPYDQAFYDVEAAKQRVALLSVHTPQCDHPNAAPDLSHSNQISAGAGQIVATPGGSDTVSVMRFEQTAKVIHIGETVEWSNADPVTPHTITFGTEPANPIPPSTNVILDADGARHATINSTADNVHSGFLLAAPQDQTGLPQTPAGVTRFRATFTHAGVYPYICVLHDDLGMVGKVIVEP